MLRRRTTDERTQESELEDRGTSPDERPPDTSAGRADARGEDRSLDESAIRTDERDHESARHDELGRDGAPIQQAHPADTVVRDRPVVVDDDGVGPVTDEKIEVVRTRSFSFGQLLTVIVGAALVVLGILALVATGVDTPLDQPVEEVLGYDHTPLLGIIEIVAGALLVLFALRPGGRWFVAAIGVALALGGFLILGELEWAVDELGAEQGYAWIPIVAGLVVLLASLLTPRRHQRMTGVPVR